MKIWTGWRLFAWRGYTEAVRSETEWMGKAMTKLTEKVLKGKRGWKVLVTWNVGKDVVVWCYANTVAEARSGCESYAKKIGLLNRP